MAKPIKVIVVVIVIVVFVQKKVMSQKLLVPNNLCPKNREWTSWDYKVISKPLTNCEEVMNKSWWTYGRVWKMNEQLQTSHGWVMKKELTIYEQLMNN